MKLKKRKKVYKVRNLPPGTMSYRGSKQSDDTHVEIINFDKDSYKKIESKRVEDAFNLKGNGKITWVNVNGLNDVKEIEKLGLHYNLHPLTLEDIVNTNHRPKLDEYDNYIFIVLKMIFFKEEDDLKYEQISLIVGEDFVLTFQEADGDVFNELRERISTPKGRIRGAGSDYLMYSILDAIVDNYITVIEAFGDKIEDLEDDVFVSSSDNEMINSIQLLKREVLKIRRSASPLREVISKLNKTESTFVEEKTHDYLRDLYDHIINVNENIEIYREMIWSLMDMYMSIISNKMNEVRKVLTIIATIFIPLTFIAGIYGMNFTNMPELQAKNGYFILLGVMVVLFILMLFYFRRKKWL